MKTFKLSRYTWPRNSVLKMSFSIQLLRKKLDQYVVVKDNEENGQRQIFVPTCP